MPGDTTFDYSQHRDVLASWFADYLEHEPNATRVRHYSPGVIPGWLQTDQYTLALDEGTGEPGTSAQTRARRMDVRRARRRLLEIAEVHIVIHEAVFWRQVEPDCPSEKIMREQLEHLRRASEAPKVTVRVLPVQRSLLRGAFSQFTVLGFPGGEGLVYREGQDSESLSHDQERVTVYVQNFERLASVSIDLPSYLAMAADRTLPPWLNDKDQ